MHPNGQPNDLEHNSIFISISTIIKIETCIFDYYNGQFSFFMSQSFNLFILKMILKSNNLDQI